MSSLARSPQHPRLLELDFLRFCAAIGVVLFHYLFRGWAGMDHLSNLNFDRQGEWAKYGYLGVDLFFMISGFVVLLSAEGKTVQAFVTSRFLRLFPAFWLCTTATYLALVLLHDGKLGVGFTSYLANLTMMPELLNAPMVDGVYWTLMVELKFYFLVFLVSVLRQFHRLEWLMLGWLAISLFMQLHGSIKGLHFLLIPENAACFAAGVGFYRIWKKGLGWKNGSIVLGAYGVNLHAAYKVATTEPSLATHPINFTIVIAITTLFFLIMLAISLGWSRRLARPWMAAAGGLTYPLYLLHQNLGYSIFNHYGSERSKYLLFWLVLSTMLALSYVVSVHVEKIITNWLRSLIRCFRAAVFPVAGQVLIKPEAGDPIRPDGNIL
jgi:peptidoglycan/LPS O-acetylase OafA/YrhL